MRTALVSLMLASAMTLCAGPPVALGQSASGPGDAWTVPRTPWGDPDLQGTWPGTSMMGVPLERPRELGDRLWLTDEEFAARQERARRQAEADNEVFVASTAAAGGFPGAGTGPPGHWGERGQPQRQSSLIIDPPNGRLPPMTVEGERRTASIPRGWYFDNSGGGPFAGPEELSVYDRCITRGVVGSMVPVGYNAGQQIVQSPGYVALRNEMMGETRIIPLDGRPPLPATFRHYMGESRGWWDGDTLVVETTNLTDKTGIGANGRALYHSDAVRLTERFRRTAEDTLQYEVTVEDPKTWSRAFTLSFPLKLEPEYGMFEYACHEGNYGLRNILSASRATDQAQ